MHGLNALGDNERVVAPTPWMTVDNLTWLTRPRQHARGVLRLPFLAFRKRPLSIRTLPFPISLNGLTSSVSETRQPYTRPFMSADQTYGMGVNVIIS